MKKTILFTLLLSFLFSVNYMQAQTCYELVWSDEFNYEGLPDPEKWSHEVGATGWGNNELQYYTDQRLENTRVEDGSLIIEARKEEYKGSSYTSARLISYPNGHSWKYGKIEARIKLPYGQGIWPAFWMLGNGIMEGTAWPACGEIDILEMIGGGEGRDDVTHGTIHWADENNNHASYGGHTQLSEGIFADTFHVFSIEWNSSSISWFLDGVKFHTVSITPAALSEFHENFFLILNLAVGGNWPGYPDAFTVFPQQMLVDYVRVYQQNNQAKVNGKSEVIKGETDLVYSVVESDSLSYTWTVPDGAEITDGQGTNSINVNWGCAFGNVSCEISGLCSTYTSELPVQEKALEVVGESKIEANESELWYSISPSKSANYKWTVPADVVIQSPTDSNAIMLNWSNQSGTLQVVVENLCGSDTTEKNVSVIEVLPYPDAEKPHQIPGIIEAVHYDQGGEGFSYHDTDAANNGTGSRQEEGVDTEPNDGGENVGWIVADEWLHYTVEVKEESLYDIDFRVASLYTSGKFKLLFNGVDKTGDITVPNTGAWTSFTTITAEDVSLSTSDTSMKIYMDGGDFNLGQMVFWRKTSNATTTQNTHQSLVYPTRVSEKLFRSGENIPSSYGIYDQTGRLIKLGKVGAHEAINVSDLKQGFYFIRFDAGSNAGQANKFIKIQ